MRKAYWLPLMFAAAASTLASCSSDEPVSGPETETTGETAYMMISLRDANDLTRTRAGEGGDLDPNQPSAEGEFEYGTANEGSIKSARFFFFDADGIYTGQSTIWNGGTASTGDPAGNIEFRGNSVVVLDNLKSNNYPKYMVTVLNGGGEYTNDKMTGKSISDFGMELTNWGTNSDGGFVMTTSSYFKGSETDAAHDDARYFATVLNESNFARTPDAAKNLNPVNVYVERLAARIHLQSAAEFPVDATVMGADGDNPEVGGNPGVAGTEMFVRIDGWYVNGIQQQSRLSKQFGTWTSSASLTDVNNWAWNVPVFHRSYWGQSVGYGSQTKEGLTFYPYNNPNVRQAGKYDYCNENTSTFANLSAANNGLPNQQLMTSVVIKATVGTKGSDGVFKPLDIIEYGGVYFTRVRFINYVLDSANRDGKLNYYTRTGSEGAYTYTQVTPAMFTIAGNNDRVQVAKGANFPSQIFAKNGNDYVATTADNLNADLAAITASVRTRAFNGGAMYYNIPVAHMNTKTYDAYGDLATWYEGSFGVVRNHTYEITINSVKRLGQGVFDPDSEEIVPDPDPKDPNWFLGATINVLSWKIVSSVVDL